MILLHHVNGNFDEFLFSLANLWYAAYCCVSMTAKPADTVGFFQAYDDWVLVRELVDCMCQIAISFEQYH